VQQDGPGAGEPHPTPTALEQFDPKLRFKASDLVTHGGRRDAQCVAGRYKTPVFCRLVKRVQVL